MSLLTLRIRFTLIFSLIALLAFSQRRDSIMHDYYKVDYEATLNIDFQHTTLTILPSENDSIAIHTRIRVIPTNPNAPFAGITYKAKQKNKNNISATLAIGEDLQPHNDLQASCEILIPKHVHLKLKSRYGIVNINAPTGLLEANLTYTNLTVDTLSQDFTHHITADYSTVVLNASANGLKIDGKNSNIKADSIQHLETKTDFSFFNIAAVRSLQSQSYTDKFVLGSVDSVYINSKKSLCLINELKLFFQGEMKGGALTLGDINAGFKVINIANTEVTSQLNFNPDCHFSLNADMRYCLLKQEQLALQKIVSPNSTLYNGNYGEATKTPSNLSIISAYGDVSIHLK